MRYPRYMTYAGDEELDAAIGTMDPLKLSGVTAGTLRQGTRGGNGLLKSHDCAVLFPDGATGTCQYTRGGPAWHVFRFRHPGRGEQTIRPMEVRHLPVQYITDRMENTPTTIALKAQELADAAYTAAIRAELRDHFRRVMPPQGHKPNPDAAQFSTKRAKEIAGRYALCARLGTNLLPLTGDLFDDIEKANGAWTERGDPKLLVACACRWSRRWELPGFNTIYADL